MESVASAPIPNFIFPYISFVSMFIDCRQPIAYQYSEDAMFVALFYIISHRLDDFNSAYSKYQFPANRLPGFFKFNSIALLPMRLNKVIEKTRD